MTVDLAGKAINQAGTDLEGLTVQLWEAANWETPGVFTAETATDPDGRWQFLAQDATKTWIVVVIDGAKKYLIDSRNCLQLTKMDIITDINVDVINEHTAAAGVTIDGLLIKDGVAPTTPPQKLKPNLTRWVMPGWYAASTCATAPTVGRIYYQPIFVEEMTTYIRIGVDVSLAAAGTADLRIFNWADGVPGALVLSAGTVDTGATGLKEITISQQLTRKYYFLAVRCTAACNLIGIPTTSALRTPVSGLQVTNTAPGGQILYVDAAYADPAPAPTGVLGVGFALVRLREN